MPHQLTAADLPIVSPDATHALGLEAFGDARCSEWGITVLRGATSWGAHESRQIAVPRKDGWQHFSLAYDEREAPYVVDSEDAEHLGLLVSLADERDFLACAWAQVEPGSTLVGVGVDLCSADDFSERPATLRFRQLLFTDRERELAPLISNGDASLAFATLFGAKEAAFKATARPLRMWYQSHDEELSFEVRHFAMDSLGIERGEARNGAAQAALDRMGISRIEIRSAPIEGMALVVATAFAARTRPSIEEEAHGF